MKSKHSIRRVVRVIGLGMVLLVVVVAASEMLFRMYPDVRPSRVNERIEFLYEVDPEAEPWWIDDDELGWLEKPLRNEQITTLDFSYTRKTDEFGFSNNPGWPDGADIVFLGDSLLNGIGVGIQGQLTTKVSNYLSGATVINLALAGASPQHLLRLYNRFGAGLRPRVVIACLYLASDVNNSKIFHVWQETGRKWPYLEFRGERFTEAYASMLANRGLRNQGDTVGKRSSIADALKNLVRNVLVSSAVGREILFLSEPYRKKIVHEVSWPDGSSVYLSAKFYEKVRDAFYDGFPDLEQLFYGPLIELRDAARSDGATFVVALIPSKEEIFLHEADRQTLRLVGTARDYLEKAGIPVIDLYPVVDAAADRAAPFYPHDIHLNAYGNDTVAQAIAAWLRESRALTETDREYEEQPQDNDSSSDRG